MQAFSSVVDIQGAEALAVSFEGARSKCLDLQVNVQEL